MTSRASKTNLYYKKRKKRKLHINWAKIAIVFGVLAVIACAIIFVPKIIKNVSNVKYLASTTASVELYYYDDYERRLFLSEDTFARGTQVKMTDREYTENGVTYTIIEYNGSEYYVLKDYLVDSKDKIIKERDKYVRTSATVYSEYGECAIASFAKKGSHLTILGYDYLEEDGSINMYQIQTDDGTEGWVYSKYLVDTLEEAEEVYEEVYEIHAGREFVYELYGGSTETLDWYPVEKEQFEDNPILENAKAMYIYGGAIADIDDYIELAKSSGVNCMVVDLKDGKLTCPMDAAEECNPTANYDIYATTDYMTAACEKIREAGLYLIIRIVVFNDECYCRDNPEDSLESDLLSVDWPSPYSRDVWYYNVKLALEAIEKFSPNEIQFDYMRFPSEAYSMSEDENTDWKNTYGEEKAEVIQNFCYYACDMIHEKDVYVSVDVFGEAAYDYVPAYGQYWPAISNVVDAISGMPYPDHFDTSVDTWTEPYECVLEWAQYAAKRQSEIETPAIARTWVTAYNVPNWDPRTNVDAEYVKTEVQALIDGGLSGGFYTWHGSSSLSKYTEIADAWAYDYDWYSGTDEGSLENTEQTEETEETSETDAAGDD